MFPNIRQLLNDFLSLIYPSGCEACQRSLVSGEEIICTYCVSDLPRLNYHFDHDNPLFKKFRGRIPIGAVTAFLKFQKKGHVQHLMHALKYKDKPAIGVALGKAYGHELVKTDHYATADFIIPVPLHKSRFRQRGYNQSERWAAGLSEVLGIPVAENLLTRTHRTVTQTKKTRLKRWENVEVAFVTQFADQLVGKKVILVDDIVTTGSTLEACAQALIESGCAEVNIVCIAAAK